MNGSLLWRIALGFVLSNGVCAQTTLPNIFAPGQPATASAVNENFDALASAIDGLKQIGRDVAVDCGADPAALSQFFQQNTLIPGSNINIGITGACQIPPGPGITVAGGGVSVALIGSSPDASITGDNALAVRQNAKLYVQDLSVSNATDGNYALLASSNGYLELQNVDASNLEIVQASFVGANNLVVNPGGLYLSGSSYMTVSGLTVTGVVVISEGSTLASSGSVAIGSDVNQNNLMVRSSSALRYAGEDLNITGICEYEGASVASITGSANVTGRCTLSNGSTWAQYNGTATINSVPGLGRGFIVEYGSTARFGGADLVFPSAETFQVLITGNSFLELSGGGPDRSVVQEITLEMGGRALLVDTDLGALDVNEAGVHIFNGTISSQLKANQSAVRLIDTAVNASGSVFLQNNSSGYFQDITVVTPGSMLIFNSTAEVQGAQQPPLDRFSCSGKNLLNHRDFPANGPAPELCMNGFFWDRLINTLQ